MSRPKFYHTPSPVWSFKALWAVKYHLISFDIVEPIPFITGLWIRFRYGRDRVTFPVLVTRTGLYFDSYDIVLWAESRSSSGVPLVPKEHAEEIAEWNRKSDLMLCCARRNMFTAILENEEVLRKAVVPPLTYLGPIGRWLIRSSVAHAAEKYKVASASTSHEQCKQFCQELQAAVEKGNGYVVGGRFTYADITMVVALNILSMLRKPYARNMINSETTRHASIPGLAAEFPELLAWRLNILEKHFPFKHAV